MLISLGDCLPEIDPVVSFDLTLKDVISKMAEYNRGFVILVNNGSPKGILTERDVNKLFSLNVSLNEPAINFANKNIVTAKPNISIYYGIDLMLENNIRRLVLVSDDGKYVGTVTVDDILRHLDDEALTRKIKVRDLKFKNVITINSDATLYEASRC
ncbi:MAG TPA: CBS domain-containing protein [Sulfurihydrogenibium sp.]|uniref:CBS domain-containing protein n=1 Tax=Sulfurihydrogenibium sp. (strain YO3AOP1) TaxID=436114 RepID=UPI0001725FA4|nr:CBS domain-containing protein [Sulfurihydrogenibium sp. YO3AOP1]ACD66401.1 putative signal-transduction protein with CBS domains [Sulfurihydrogenibium sp. YO3AOP1]HBT98409.1 CBS domain-containing protein [Sulfurihydrogenibium sp.]